MLEGADYKNIDMVSPLFGEIVDTLTENSTFAPITEVFTQYMDPRNFIWKHFSHIGCTEKNLSKLEVQVNRFRCVAARVLKPYHSTDIAVSKLHALTYHPKALRKIGSTKYLDSGCFKSSNKTFNNQYKKMSEKIRIAVSTILAMSAIIAS